MNEVLPLALSGFTATLAVMAVAWLVSVVVRNVGVVDVAWGIAIAAAGLTWVLAHPEAGTRAALVATLTVIWAARLSLHLLWRAWGKPEDRRYQVIRARNEPGFALKSLYLVFGLQAFLAWLVAMPLLGAALSDAPIGRLDRLGTFLWAVGFAFEAIADRQMARFQRRADAGQAVMDQGLWRYSRHPNYFGEFLLWWGIGLIGLSGGAWWGLIGPALLTFFLLKVSGVALTEKDIADRRPAYRDYVLRTSAFFPRWPR
jgi:steroid 5-alpha reductase family enzyme